MQAAHACTCKMIASIPINSANNVNDHAGTFEWNSAAISYRKFTSSSSKMHSVLHCLAAGPAVLPAPAKARRLLALVGPKAICEYCLLKEIFFLESGQLRCDSDFCRVGHAGERDISVRMNRDLKFRHSSNVAVTSAVTHLTGTRMQGQPLSAESSALQGRPRAPQNMHAEVRHTCATLRRKAHT